MMTHASILGRSPAQNSMPSPSDAILIFTLLASLCAVKYQRKEKGIRKPSSLTVAFVNNSNMGFELDVSRLF